MENTPRQVNEYFYNTSYQVFPQGDIEIDDKISLGYKIDGVNARVEGWTEGDKLWCEGCERSRFSEGVLRISRKDGGLAGVGEFLALLPLIFFTSHGVVESLGKKIEVNLGLDLHQGPGPIHYSYVKGNSTWGAAAGVCSESIFLNTTGHLPVVETPGQQDFLAESDILTWTAGRSSQGSVWWEPSEAEREAFNDYSWGKVRQAEVGGEYGIFVSEQGLWIPTGLEEERPFVCEWTAPLIIPKIEIELRLVPSGSDCVVLIEKPCSATSYCAWLEGSCTVGYPLYRNAILVATPIFTLPMVGIFCFLSLTWMRAKNRKRERDAAAINTPAPHEMKEIDEEEMQLRDNLPVAV